MPRKKKTPAAGSPAGTADQQKDAAPPFLLSGTSAALVTRTENAVVKMLESFGFEKDKQGHFLPFELTDDQLNSIDRHFRAKRLSARTCAEKLKAINDKKHFSLMSIFSMETGGKSVYCEWYVLRSDKKSFGGFSSLLEPIERGSPADFLLQTVAKEDRALSQQDVCAVRDYLDLSGYSYMPLHYESRLQFLVDICKAVAAYTTENGEAEKRIINTTQYFGAGFDTIRQGIATNTLSKIVGKGKNAQATIDTYTNAATFSLPITGGSLILSIPNYGKLSDLRTTTHQLLDALLISLTESGANSPTVVLSLEAYMKKRGIRDKKEARRQMSEDAALLSGATLTWVEQIKEKRGTKLIPYQGIAIADSWKWDSQTEKKSIVFTFGTSFYNAVLGYNVMPYPEQLQRLNSKRNPNSYHLLRKLAEYKNMNATKEKTGGDIISVSSLLNSAPYIPTYEEVAKTDRAFTRRIIEPFERDMDAFSDTLSWEYCHEKGAPLTDEEAKALKIDVFKSLYIKTIWKRYPDQSARILRENEHKEEKESKSKKTPKKQKQQAGG